MFTTDFANSVILPAAQGQPSFISGPMHFFASIFLLNPMLSNLGIAVIQIGLGILILWRHTARIGLILSVIWGLFVWYVGEGLSGLASGHAMMLTGSPGAALIYALIALGVLGTQIPKEKIPDDTSMSDRRPSYWLIIVWILIWVVGAIYQVMPGQNTIADVSSMISLNASSAPTWLASVDTATINYLSNFGTTNSPSDSMAGMPGTDMTTFQPTTVYRPASRALSGFWILFMISLLQILLAFAVIIPGWVRLLAVILGSLLSLGFWIVGQSLGGYYTGTATDPNTGPLLILLGIAVLGCTQKDSKIKAFFARISARPIREMRT